MALRGVPLGADIDRCAERIGGQRRAGVFQESPQVLQPERFIRGSWLEQETGLVVAGSELHQLALEIARESRLRRRALAPELNDWLDKLEQESAAVTP